MSHSRVARMCKSILHHMKSTNYRTLSRAHPPALPSTSRTAFSSSSIAHYQLDALYTSYSKHKALRQSQQTTLSSQSPSPLLAHLDLLHTDNTLKPIDWSNWTHLRQLIEQINLYYIKDFCADFSSKHASNNNKIISDDFAQRTQYMLQKTNSGGKNNRGLLHIVSLML
eukprot:CAMPEP_0197037670 /NCGR_PEP_ID=MMETSP1384-20130603/14819_1 /TAXON_ID=29189 /ORGANISM="Ammonia sp." /LENGTH=168 /DNA_ID=CAMNT_0042468005 /DNA_START=18 /DNA_END=521 /DNA_ORIENTATION=+